MRKAGLILFSLIIAIIGASLALAPIKFLTVIGNSMEPVISEADIIIVASNLDIKYLKAGDIIAYKHELEGRYYTFTHRIVEVEEGGFRTKGDALNAPDNYLVDNSDVVGVFLFKIPYLGYFLRFSNSALGYIALILFPAIIIIAIEIKKIVGVMRGEQR